MTLFLSITLPIQLPQLIVYSIFLRYVEVYATTNEQQNKNNDERKTSYELKNNKRPKEVQIDHELTLKIIVNKLR